MNMQYRSGLRRFTTLAGLSIVPVKPYTHRLGLPPVAGTRVLPPVF